MRGVRRVDAGMAQSAKARSSRSPRLPVSFMTWARWTPVFLDHQYMQWVSHPAYSILRVSRFARWLVSWVHIRPQRSANAAQSAIIAYCGAQHISINVILYLEICAGRPIVRASRVKICDLREERLADDGSVELPDTRQIVTYPVPLGMGQKAGSPIKYGVATDEN